MTRVAAGHRPTPVRPAALRARTDSPTLGEFELIELVRARLREAGADRSPRVAIGSGDDAAVVAATGATAVSVDAMVDGVHFRRDSAPPRSVGRKALATALSDLAAVGAAPAEAYVVIGIPADLGDEASLAIADGLIAGAAEWSTTVAGGDVTASPVLFVSVTVAGALGGVEEAVRREGAAAGDVVAVTGELGGAAAGLLLLERPELAAAVPAAVAERLRERQLDPEPRLEAGRVLARSGATAMIDLSDGLGADAGHVAAANDARIEIELDRVPVAAGVQEIATASGADPLDLISGGEDYELLVCLPPTAIQAAAEAVAGTGTTLTVIGTVHEGEGRVILRDATGVERAATGHDHLRAGAERA
jgi:thiamine-monophosphate kinase